MTIAIYTVNDLFLELLLAIADALVSAYYWMTTYIPIYSRRACIRIYYDALPVLKDALLGLLALMGRALFLFAILLTSLVKHTVKIVKEGWNMRKELLEEYGYSDTDSVVYGDNFEHWKDEDYEESFVTVKTRPSSVYIDRATSYPDPEDVSALWEGVKWPGDNVPRTLTGETRRMILKEILNSLYGRAAEWHTKRRPDMTESIPKESISS